MSIVHVCRRWTYWPSAACGEHCMLPAACVDIQHLILDIQLQQPVQQQDVLEAFSTCFDHLGAPARGVCGNFRVQDASG